MPWKIRLTPFEADPMHFNQDFGQYLGDLVSAPSTNYANGTAYANTANMILYVLTNGAWSAKYNLSLIADSYLLLESGDKLLLETGDKLVLEA